MRGNVTVHTVNNSMNAKLKIVGERVMKSTTVACPFIRFKFL